MGMEDEGSRSFSPGAGLNGKYGPVSDLAEI